jgi:hypothetical protein
MLGDKVEKQKGRKPQFGVKQKPGWPFILVTHYMIPLLHCEIGIGNQLLEMLRDILNKHIEYYLPGEERVWSLIPVLSNIISKTVANRDTWDASDNEMLGKALKRKIGAAKDRRKQQNNNEIVVSEEVSSPEPAQQDTHAVDEIKLNVPEDFCNREYVFKLKKAHDTLRNQKNKLKTMRTSKVRGQDSIETKMFTVLNELGVELSSYHGGSLNGKDIKKVMNNSCHIFNTFATIFKEGKRPNCVLLDANINNLCLQF